MSTAAQPFSTSPTQPSRPTAGRWNRAESGLDPQGLDTRPHATTTTKTPLQRLRPESKKHSPASALIPSPMLAAKRVGTPIALMLPKKPQSPHHTPAGE